MTADRLIPFRRLGESLYTSYDANRDCVWITNLDVDNQTIALDRHAAEALLRFMAAVWGDSR